MSARVKWARRMVPGWQERRLAILEDLYARLVPERVLAQLAANPAGARRELTENIAAVVERRGDVLSRAELRELETSLLAEVTGFGPLQKLIDDPTCQEIMVNSPDAVWIERRGVLERTDIRFADEQHVLDILRRIVDPVGRRIDLSTPTVNARLPNGSRVHAVIAPLALGGPVITIRKFREQRFLVPELVHSGAMTEDAALLLVACVRGRLNMVVSGATGSGKTTLLNTLAAYISDTERIITIEDAAELQIPQPNTVRLEARPPNQEGVGAYPIRDLVADALRMRPDRIIVGECRRGEAFDMLQAMNTGHDGSMTTVHANSAHDAMTRLESMALMAGLDLPLRAIQRQIADAVDIVVHQQRGADGHRRVTSITEVLGMHDETIELQDIFRTDDSPYGVLTYTGVLPRCVGRLRAAGLPLPACFQS